MFVHQFTIGKIIVNNSISLNIDVVVRNTSTSCIEVSLFLFGQLLVNTEPKKEMVQCI